MIRHAVALLTVITLVGLAHQPAWGQDEEPTALKVVRFVGTRDGRAWGRPVLMLVTIPALGGAPTAVVIPNKDPMGRKRDPSDVVMNVLKDLKPGDVIETRVVKFMGKDLLRSVRRYDAKPGETEPNVFVFERMVQHKLGRYEYDGIVVSKFRKSQTVLIPRRRNRDGNMASDEDLLGAARKIKEGDSVELEVQPRGRAVMLKSLYPYEPPRKGEFVKIVHRKIDDQEYTGIELKAEDGNQVLLIPNKKVGRGKPFPDPKLARQIRALRPGKAVLYKVHEDDKGVWLRKIRLAPKAPASKPSRSGRH